MQEVALLHVRCLCLCINKPRVFLLATLQIHRSKGRVSINTKGWATVFVVNRMQSINEPVDATGPFWLPVQSVSKQVAHVIINKPLQPFEASEEGLKDNLWRLRARQHHETDAHGAEDAEKREDPRGEVFVLTFVLRAGWAHPLSKAVGSIRWEMPPDGMIWKEVPGAKEAFLFGHRVHVETLCKTLKQ